MSTSVSAGTHAILFYLRSLVYSVTTAQTTESLSLNRAYFFEESERARKLIFCFRGVCKKVHVHECFAGSINQISENLL